MTLEKLSRENSLHQRIVETQNHLNMLEEWIKELKKDASVSISSNEGPNKSIIGLHVLKGLPLVEKRLKELKERLDKIEKDFNSL